MPEKLDKETFSQLFQHGRGNAARYIKQYGLSDVVDIVQTACLKQQVYDRQCEPSRAPWLFDLIHPTAHYHAIAQAILNALEQETEIWDLEQLCEFSVLMARAGDTRAAVILRQRVLEIPFSRCSEVFGWRALVEMDGIDAIFRIVSVYGNYLMKHPQKMVASLEDMTDDAEMLAKAIEQLHVMALTDPGVKAYLDDNPPEDATNDMRFRTDEERRLAVRQRIRNELNLQQIIADAHAGLRQHPSQYMRFGRAANQDELECVLQELLNTSNEETRMRLLWVFRRAEMPRIDERLWAFLISSRTDIRADTLEALSRCQDIRIGDNARKLLAEACDIDDVANIIKLFIRNYQAGDESLISQAISSKPVDVDTAHRIGYVIIDLFQKYSVPAFADLLKWVYQTNPCTACRRKTLEALIGIGNPYPEIVDECLFDSSPNVRKVARALA